MVDTKRTDIHKPSVIQPQDYDYVAMGYMKIDSLLALAWAQQERERLERHMRETGGTYSKHLHGGNCMICGAHCIYTAVFHHRENNEYIRCGTICASKMGMGDARLFKSFRKACQEALRNQKGKAKAQALLAEHSLDQAWMIYQEADDIESKFAEQVHYNARKVVDLVNSVVRYGKLTDPQIKFIRSLLDQINRWPEIEAQRKREREAAEDCPEGKIIIEGTLISVKNKQTNFGCRTVMTVKDNRGFLVWGTLPSALYNADKGDKVKFSANVTPSDSDSKFGFFKRPTKPEIVERKSEKEKANA